MSEQQPDRQDPFAPAMVDSALDRLRAAHQQSQAAGTALEPEARLVGALDQFYRLPTEAEPALARVRGRLRAHADALPTADAHVRTTTYVRSTSTDMPSHDSPPSRPTAPTIPPPETRLRRAEATLRGVAAVVVAALIVSGFLAILLQRHTSSSTSAWLDAGITSAKVGSKRLDFDPTKGVTYAVSTSSGAIYVCGVGDHLWQSNDGGASYQPFLPDLSSALQPPLTQAALGTRCAISSVLGAPGVFVVNTVPKGNTSYTQIYYAVPGGQWQQLIVNGDAIGAPPTPADFVSVPVPAKGITESLDTGLLTSWLRVSGNWFFAALLPDTSTDPAQRTLVGSPDFGRSWVWLDAPLARQHLAVRSYAVDPADPTRIVVEAGGVTSNGLTGPPQLWQTQNSGKTWQPLPYGDSTPLQLLGITATDTYVVREGSSANGVTQSSTLLLHAVAPAGAWRESATLPTPGDAAQFRQVAPDGTVYLASGKPVGAGLTVSLSTLTANGKSPTTNTSHIDFNNRGKSVFALGGIWPSGTPSLYLLDPYTSSGVGQLYRLPLNTTGTSAAVNAAPFTVQPTPTTRPACTSTPGNLADIQDGGIGAQATTFDRWGAPDGVAAGNVAVGPRDATGTPLIYYESSLSANQRVYFMTYNVPINHRLTLAEAQQVAATILPRDVQPVEPPQHTDRYTVAFNYCSAALLAAFPESESATNEAFPLMPHNGIVVVHYVAHDDGSIWSIAFSLAQ